MAQALGPRELLEFYAQGVFPMADSRDANTVAIIDPPIRGIIPLDAIHLPRRLRRTIRQDVYEVRTDSAFADVIAACAAPGKGRKDTWISHGIEQLYAHLFEMGAAHSVECWHKGALVGGLYGVRLGGAFFGESMFSVKRDASKVALIHLCARLLKGGFCLLDTQFLTTHLAQFGAVDIAREDYHLRLEKALNKTADFCALPVNANGQMVLNVLECAAIQPLQSSTHTS